MNDNDIMLENYYLKSLFRTNKDDLEYLKKIEHNENSMTYFDTLTVYIGRKNAYIIQKKEENIGFLVIANDAYFKEDRNTKEIYIIIDEEHQNLGLGTSVLSEATDYLLTLDEVDNVIISPFNKKTIALALNVGYEEYDGFKLIKRKRKRSR